MDDVMRILMWTLGGVGAVVGGVGVVFVGGMRFGVPAVVDRVRRFNRRITNPRVMRRAGAEGPYAVVHHVGRRSGRAYDTPVEPVPTADGFVVALPYGDRADWLRNVLAAGRCELTLGGDRVAVTDPELVPTASLADVLPAGQRRVLRLFGVDECLRLRHAPRHGPVPSS